MAAVALRNIRSWGGPARVAIAALAIVAILFLFVFPTRSFLSQRAAIDDARHDLDVLRTQNERLEEEAARLQTPSEIEREAREQFHMVYPRERAFAVTPAPVTSTTVP
ncbi:MAG: FtsB family cell division protein [Actinomycetota bacterium]